MDITYQQNEQGLRDVTKTNTVYLKRHLQDLWLNNYNMHLSRAWNANLHAQYDIDAYAAMRQLEYSYFKKMLPRKPPTG